MEPFFSPLPASSYPYHPAPTPPYRTSPSYLLLAFALLFSKYPCGVFSAKAAFREDLIPLFFCAWAAWVLWVIYVRGWVSWLVGWLGAGFSCELRLVQQTALRTQAAACSIERAGGGFGFGWMAWKAYVGLAGLNVRVFLRCDQLVLLCAGPACA